MERSETAYGAWFQKIPYIGSKTMLLLKKRFGTLEDAYKAPYEQLKTVLNARQLTTFMEEKKSVKPLKYLEEIENKGIRYIGYEDDVYPQKLRNIPDAPFGLFVKGSLPDERKPSVAIIGARVCSEYGSKVAEEFGAKLAGLGIQIISGMAKGIDSISQKACIDSGGETFAILGNGVDICYPAELKKLYKDIQTKGGLISAYAPGMPPVAMNFPPRNRIISGLADMVLVVEAREKSGTLITVDMALEQGKEVAVIPGRITDGLSKGCNQLIKQGACVIVDVEQFLELLKENTAYREYFAGNSKVTKDSSFSISADFSENRLNDIQKFILNLLKESPTDPREAEYIYAELRKNGYKESFQELMEHLLDLELMDLCKSNKNCFTIR